MDHVLEAPETPGQRRIRRLKRFARGVLVLAFTYGVVVLAARVLHRYVLYQPPEQDVAAPAPAGATLLTLQTSDGVSVHALELAGSSGRVVVHFHGNAETADQNATLGRLLQKHGLGVVLVEYRGYGRSAAGAQRLALPGVSAAPAAPHEAGLYADAEAVLADLAARGTRPENIVLWGQSLGTGVATEMARRGRGQRLVLVAPFTSTVAMAQASVPFLPGALVMTDTFDSLSKAPALTLPVYVVHGDSDTVIPLEQGKRLAAAFPHAELREVPMGTHVNLYKNTTTFDALVAFATK